MDEFNEDENDKIECETFHTESFFIALLIIQRACCNWGNL